MVAAILQLVALAGFPVGGFMAASWGGFVIGASVSAGYVGLAIERAGS